MAGRISVILPTYNRCDLIGETLDSLLAQTRMPVEILVVDDGSTDETRSVLAAYGAPVRCLHKENGGKASALNLALEQVEGDLIWICDDDDLLLPDAAERLAGRLDQKPELGWCAGRHEDFTEDPTDRMAPGYWRASAPDELFSDLLDGCHIFQPGLIVRKSVYDRVGAFDTALTRSQDYEMLLRIARAAPGELLTDTVFLHRTHMGDRGSAKERFSAAEMTAKWIKFHRQIMQPLMLDLRDQELLPARIIAGIDSDEARARAYGVKRASVYGRHLMWAEALAEFRKIAESAGADFLQLEDELIIGSTLYSLGCRPLYADPQIVTAAMDLKRSSPRGRAIVNRLAKSLRWRVRSTLQAGDWMEAWRIGRFILRANALGA